VQEAHLTGELQRSREEVVGVLEEERRRMRRDLHDGLGPTLTGIAYSADAAMNLARTGPPGGANVVLRELRAPIGEAIAEIRRIIHGLRPRRWTSSGWWELCSSGWTGSADATGSRSSSARPPPRSPTCRPPSRWSPTGSPFRR
jgi:hypothetical protein